MERTKKGRLQVPTLSHHMGLRLARLALLEPLLLGGCLEASRDATPELSEINVSVASLY